MTDPITEIIRETRQQFADDQRLKARDKALAEINAWLALITGQINRYKSYDDDRLDWGHVGDLKRIAAKLKELF